MIAIGGGGDLDGSVVRAAPEIRKEIRGGRVVEVPVRVKDLPFIHFPLTCEVNPPSTRDGDTDTASEVITTTLGGRCEENSFKSKLVYHRKVTFAKGLTVSFLG